MAEMIDPVMQKQAEKFYAAQHAKATKAILQQCKDWRTELYALKGAWEKLNESKRSSPLCIKAMELLGGAVFPPYSDLKRIEHWIYNVENGVARNYNKKLPQWMENADWAIRSTDAKYKSYLSRLDRGGDIAMSALVPAKRNGMIAVGILAGYFVGPVVLTKLAVEGALTGAMLTGATAKVITKNVDIVATTIGRASSGEKLDVTREMRKAIRANEEAFLTGLVTGPFNKVLGAKVIGPLFKSAGVTLTKFDSAILTGYTSAALQADLKRYLGKRGKSELAKAVKAVKGKTKRNDTEDKIRFLILSEVVKSRDFLEFVKKNAKETAK